MPSSKTPQYLPLLLLFSVLGLACGGTDDDPCASDPTCSAALDEGAVRLTYLDVQYDLSQPVYLNNRVPIEYGLTTTAPGAEGQVAVTFSFVEAVPTDPAEPIECASNALTVNVSGDGVEERFSGYIWPTSLCDQLVGREVNIRVEFNGGEEVENTVDAPAVAFTEAARSEALNALCLSSTGEAGCVYDFDLQPVPSDANGGLIDVLHAGMATDSAVAVLPLDETTPAFSIESVFTVNGRDPYITPTPVEEIPADVIAEDPEIIEGLQFGLSESEAAALLSMPGTATLSYSLRPLGSTDEFLPLLIALNEESAHLERDEIVSLLPGTPNTFTYQVFAEGDTYAALAPEGAWAAESDFEVMGCFEADFPQAGNEGGYDAGSDCRTVEIVLTRESSATSAATAHEFNRTWTTGTGNANRIRGEVGLETLNRLDLSGASSSIDAFVSLRGRIGRNFQVDIARATASAVAGIDPAANGYEVAVVAFGETLFEVSQGGAEIEREEDFSVAKSFSFPNLGFGFGPVRIGIQLSLGGEAGISLNDSLFVTTDSDRCDELVESSVACGQISRTTEPFIAFTGRLFGGLRAGPFYAGLEADIRIIRVGLPVETSLGFGASETGALSIVGEVDASRNIAVLQGDVSIVGGMRVRRRFIRFHRRMRVNLFRINGWEASESFLNRSVALEVLQ